MVFETVFLNVISSIIAVVLCGIVKCIWREIR